MKRTAILSLVVLLGSGATLKAQDLWDPSFKLSAGSMSGADTAGIGQNHVYGLSMEGAYPLTRNHLVVFEAGYRVFPSASRVDPTTKATTDDKTSGYFVGAAYRFRFTQGMLDGLYAQGGLRFHSLKAERDTVTPGGALDGSDLRTVLKGSQATSTKPYLGAGFRFTEKLSVEVNLAGLQAQNVNGVAKSGTVIEVALGIHL
jgi:hypothetical protein